MAVDDDGSISPAYRPSQAELPLGWKLALPPVAVVMLLTMPVWLPLVSLDNALDRRRRRRIAERTACGRCGAVLGADGLARGDAAWAARMAQWRADHPYAIPRIVRRLHAVCGRCGEHYEFDGATFVAMREL